MSLVAAQKFHQAWQQVPPCQQGPAALCHHQVVVALCHHQVVEAPSQASHQVAEGPCLAYWQVVRPPPEQPCCQEEADLCLFLQVEAGPCPYLQVVSEQAMVRLPPQALAVEQPLRPVAEDPLPYPFPSLVG